MAMVGDDIVLPCQLETPVDAVSMTMEWGRPDLNPRFVYVWHDGQELQVDQNKAYKGKASLSINKLKHGDLSLSLSKANVFDNGIYRCYIPKLREEHLVELLVGKSTDFKSLLWRRRCIFLQQHTFKNQTTLIKSNDALS